MRRSIARFVALAVVIAALAQFSASASAGEANTTLPTGKFGVGGTHSVVSEAAAPAPETKSGSPERDSTPIPSRPSGGPRAASSMAGNEQWHTSMISSGNTMNCMILGQPYTEQLGLSWTGWYGDYETQPTTPRVNDVYYTTIGWAVTGYPCGAGGAHVHAELNLPANTQLAISNQNKVRCYYKSINSDTYKEFTDASCPQQPQSGQQGGYAFDPGTGEGAWPTASTASFEILIPVKTTKRLTTGYSSTGPCAACLSAGIWMIDGNYSPWSYPRIGVFVDGGNPPPPSVSYPIPSVTNVQYDPDPSRPNHPSTARTTGYVYTQGTGGTATFEIGETKQYGNEYSIALPLNDGFDEYAPWVEWSMHAGKTWHWRLCYQPQGQAEICGADQTFKTAPPPDTIAPQTTVEKGPRKFTNSTKANFELSANELNVTYVCRLDDGPFQPCESSSPSFQDLTEGRHTLYSSARDGSGNEDPTPAVYAWTVDTTKPNTSITSGPSGTVKSNTASFKFSANEPKTTFLCSLDGSRFKACSSGVTYKDLKNGKHNFAVKAKDRAGNVDPTPARKEWRVT